MTTGVVDRTEQQVEDDRREYFIDIGFLPDEAVALSRARDHKGILISRTLIKNALDQGCDLRTAAKVFS